MINRGVVGLLWVAAIGLPAMLFCDHYPQIRDFNSPVAAQFGKEMAKSMPTEPAIVLADDPARLYLAMGARQSLGLPDQYIFVESQSLVHREYLCYLADRHPIFGKELVNRDRIPQQITEEQAGELLAHLVRQAAGLLFASQLWQPVGGSLHDAAPLGRGFASLIRPTCWRRWRCLRRQSPQTRRIGTRWKRKRWPHCQNWQRATRMPDGSPGIIRKFWITGAPNCKRPGRGANCRSWSKTRTLSSWRPFASIRTTWWPGPTNNTTRIYAECRPQARSSPCPMWPCILMTGGTWR